METSRIVAVDSPQWVARLSWANLRTFAPPPRFIPGPVLIYILSSQHACIPSTWLCSLLKPRCRWSHCMADLEPIQQLYFLGDWLFKNLSRNPQMFPPRVWGRVAIVGPPGVLPVCVDAMLGLRVVGGAGLYQVERYLSSTAQPASWGSFKPRTFSSLQRIEWPLCTLLSHLVPVARLHGCAQ